MKNKRTKPKKIIILLQLHVVTAGTSLPLAIGCALILLKKNHSYLMRAFTL